MEIKQLRYFQQVASDLSFSKAAKNLFLSQQALSKSIQNLEQELHAPLFERTHTGLVLTGFGAQVLERSYGITGGADEVFRLAGEAVSGSFRIRVAFCEVTLGANADFSVDDILRFEKDYPDIVLDMAEAPSDECLRMVDDDRADIAVVIGPVDLLRYRCRRLLDEEAAVIVSSRNPLATCPDPTLEDLREQCFYIPRGCTASMRDVCDTFFSQGLECPARERFVFPNCTPAMVVQATYDDRGICLMPMNHIDLIDRERACVLDIRPRFHVSRCVVERRDAPAKPQIEAFREHLIALAERVEATSRG